MVALMVAVGYLLAGMAVFPLTSPPSYASAFWPSAGLAFVAILFLGYRVWPGVLLGSILMTLYTSGRRLGVGPQLIGLIPWYLEKGIGVVLQGVVGVYLVRRFVGYPKALLGAAETFLTLGIAGPMACLISATAGVSLLWIRHGLPVRAIPSSWFSWYVGDTLGVLIVVPLALVWLGEPASQWRPRRLQVTLPLLVALTLSLGAFFLVRQQTQAPSVLPWLVQAGALLFTGLLGVFLLMVTGWGQSVANEVMQRTLKLNAVNRDLSSEIAERRKVEVNLKETNAYLENLINCANAPIIIWDPEFRITRFNPAFEALTGRTEADVLGRSLEILFPIASVENSMDLIRKTLAAERWETVAIKILSLDGTVKTLLWNSATLFAADGATPVAIIAQGQDITDWIKSKEALQVSEEKFARIYHLSPDAINLTHLGSNQFVEVNSSHEKMFGYTHAELIGHTPLPGDIDLWADIQDRNRFIAKLKENGEVIEFAALMKRKNGDIFDAIISSSLIEILGEGYILSVTRDISKRMQAEKALQASEEKFSKTFRSAPLLVALSLLENGQLIDVNELYCQTMGFTREELIGRSTTELGIVRLDDRQRLIKIVELKGSAKNVELEMYAKNGQRIPCLFSGETVSVGEQKVLISMVTDVTELKQALEHDRLLEAQLQQSQKMESLGALVAGVAHNINNVLAIIILDP